MSRFALVAGTVVVAACGVDAVDAIPDGLVVSQQTTEHVAGTFGGNGHGIQFDFSRRGAAGDAMLCDATGATLEDVVNGSLDGTGFVDANILDRMWVVTAQGDSALHIDGDPSALADLAARPELVLIAPLQAALSAAGLTSMPPQGVDAAPAALSVDLLVRIDGAWGWSTIYLAGGPSASEP